MIFTLFRWVNLNLLLVSRSQHLHQQQHVWIQLEICGGGWRREPRPDLVNVGWGQNRWFDAEIHLILFLGEYIWRTNQPSYWLRRTTSPRTVKGLCEEAGGGRYKIRACCEYAHSRTKTTLNTNISQYLVSYKSPSGGKNQVHNCTISQHDGVKVNWLLNSKHLRFAGFYPANRHHRCLTRKNKTNKAFETRKVESRQTPFFFIISA